MLVDVKTPGTSLQFVPTVNGISTF